VSCAFTAILGLLLFVATAAAQTFDYTLAPTAEWEAGTPNPTITLNSSGQPTPAMSTVSRYLHGSWHSTLGQQVKFTLTMPAAGIVGLTSQAVAASGTKTVSILDGTTTLGTHSFVGAESWEVALTAGTHTITFRNDGEDWVDVASFYFRSGTVAPPSPPPAPTPAAAGTVTSFAWQQSTVPLFAKAEATFQLSQTYTNPYDPALVAVDAVVTGPGGIAYEMPAFWFEQVGWETKALGQYSNFTARVAGSGCWKLRLAPEAVGTWSVVIRVTTGLGQTTSSAYTFTATASPAPGFVRLDPADRQGFRFDSGAPYLPFGFNLAWQDGSNGTFFGTYLTQMRANGVNWARYWFTPFARQSLEWSDDHWFTPYAGLAKYSQEAAALLDHVVQKAETEGVYLQLVFEQHGLYSTAVDPLWSENPYNSAKTGGWLTSPGQFFTDSTAIDYAKKKYRYTVARWGYSTHVFAWELFNEANFSGGANADVAAWHKTISSYVKTIDPYAHLVTTSTSRTQLDLMSSHADLDVLQEHIYADPIAARLAILDADLLSHYTKNVIVGEFGAGNTSSYNNGAHPDAWGDHVRQACWIGSMKRVPNMFWFWDTYIQAKNLYSTYRPLAQFWRGEDLGVQPGLTGATLAVQRSGTTDSTLVPYGLKSSTAAYAYVINSSFGEWAATASTVTGASLQVSGLAAGDWRATFVDPVTGTFTNGPVVTAVAGTVTAIPLPAFTKDIAIKLRAAGVRETYEQWQARLFTFAEILDGTAAAANSLASDGTTNLLHFALGIDNPRQPLPPSALPVLEVTGTQVVFRFASVAGGIAYVVERSTDLTTWTTVQRIEAPSAATTSVILGSTSDAPHLFARLRVEQD